MNSSIKMIQIFETTNEYIEKFNQLANMELEVRFGKFEDKFFNPNLDRMTFGRISNYCYNFFKELNTSIEELDVYVVDSQKVSKRITISGRTNIDYFMTFGNIRLLNMDNVQVILQKNKENDDYTDLNFRVSLATETPLDKNVNMEFDGITLIRHKFRQSYFAMDDKFRLDNTIVKEYNFGRGKKSLHNLETSDFIERYQFEIEAVQKITKSELENIVTEFVVFIQDTGHITLNSEVVEMQKKYNQLTGSDNKFIGLKPITITPENKKDISLTQQDYSVTLKADGERYLLFVSNNLYFITMNMQYIDTGLYVENLDGYILDGEFIKEKNEYLIFDIFYSKGQDTRKKDLKERIKLMNEFEAEIKTKVVKSKHNFISNRPTLDIHCKKYYFSSDEGLDLKSITYNLLKISSESSAVSGYKYDGVIFTPNAPYAFDVKIYKWKKHEDNTIDFYISSFDDRVKYGNVEYIKTPLYVGSSAKPVEPVIFKPNLSKSEFNEQNVSFIYIPVFQNGPRTTQDQLQLQPGCIVECAWLDMQKAHNVPVAIKQFGWVAQRIRLDKTSKIYTKNDFQGTMNNGWVANQIWNSIENPISIDELFTEKYYSSNARESVAEPMHKFHNFIKSTLIERYGSNRSFIDFTCGQGADIRKWSDAKVKSIIGLDKYEENIKKLLSRLENGKVNLENIPHLFKSYESNLPLFNEDGIPINDNWKTSTSSFQEFDMFFKTYKPFDVSSAFFSIHYFFNSLENLKGLLWNVYQSMNIGGHFLVTCIDGDKLYDFFDKKELNYEWVIKAQEKPVFILKKDYVDQGKKNFGLQVSMKSHNIQGTSNSNTYIPEWVVFPKILIEEANKLGLTVKEIVPFESFLNSFANFNDFYNYLAKNLRDPKMSDLLEFSKMHTVFVFEKTGTNISDKYILSSDKTFVENKPIIPVDAQKNIASASTITIVPIPIATQPTTQALTPQIQVEPVSTVKKSRKSKSDSTNQPPKKIKKSTESNKSSQPGKTTNSIETLTDSVPQSLSITEITPQTQPITSEITPETTPETTPLPSQKSKKTSPVKEKLSPKSKKQRKTYAKSGSSEPSVSSITSNLSQITIPQSLTTSGTPTFSFSATTNLPQIFAIPTSTTETSQSQIPLSTPSDTQSITTVPTTVPKPKRQYKKREKPTTPQKDPTKTKE